MAAHELPSIKTILNEALGGPDLQHQGELKAKLQRALGELERANNFLTKAIEHQSRGIESVAVPSRVPLLGALQEFSTMRGPPVHNKQGRDISTVSPVGVLIRERRIALRITQMKLNLAAQKIGHVPEQYVAKVENGSVRRVQDRHILPILSALDNFERQTKTATAATTQPASPEAISPAPSPTDKSSTSTPLP